MQGSCPDAHGAWAPHAGFWTSSSPRSLWSQFRAESDGTRGGGLHPEADKIFPPRTPAAGGEWRPGRVPCQPAWGRAAGRCGPRPLASCAAPVPRASLVWASPALQEVGQRVRGDPGGQGPGWAAESAPSRSRESRPLCPEVEKHPHPNQGLPWSLAPSPAQGPVCHQHRPPHRGPGVAGGRTRPPGERSSWTQGYLQSRLLFKALACLGSSSVGWALRGGGRGSPGRGVWGHGPSGAGEPGAT